MSLREFIPAPLRALRRRVLDRLSLGPRPIGVSYDPRDRQTAENMAEQLFQTKGREQPLGTIGRGRLILQIIEETFPTERLEAEYFRNLELLLSAKEKRAVPGRILLGLGSGRSGSTSLTALLGTVQGSCCTHENPPLIYWTPESEQIQFHIKRFRYLRQYFSLVADVSHWWLNAFDSVLREFPDVRAVGLYRDVKSCAKSFMGIKGRGLHTLNHWVPYGNGIWASHVWDLTYPAYPIPANARQDPDSAKYELIVRYVRDYNDRLADLAKRLPNHVLLARTEDFDKPATQGEIFDFAGTSGRTSKLKLNERNVVDGESANFRF